MYSEYLAALKVKNEGSAEHSRRVFVLAERFIKFIPLSSDMRQRIRICSLYHDIGKLMIPEEILDKPGKLTDEQWIVMKQHPIWSGRFLAALHSGQSDINIVRAHHERVDGRGYPMQLDAGSIPFAAKVIAICDSVDAMLSSRCYRPKPLSHNQCKAELHKGAGTQYDAQLVSLFLKHWEDIVFS